MLNVTNLAGLCEPITKYNNYEKHEEVNGRLELSLTSFPDEHNPGHDLIDEESIIETDDGYKFRVKQISMGRLAKQVKALSTYFDLNTTYRDDIFGGTKTLNEFVTWNLAGTGWTFENEDVNDARLLPNFGDSNVVSLNDILITAFECEFQILPNNRIRFAKKIGPDNDAQYRYRHNIKTLSKKVDTTRLRTRIKGIGANGLTVTYTSPNHIVFGHRDAETIKDDNFTSVESLTELIKTGLIDYPEVSIELEAIELQGTVIGESVWLIYEPLGVSFQTRVLTGISRIPESKSSVILGNAIPRSLTDILTSTKAEIDLNKKESRSRIEQTNEKILLEVGRVDGDIIEAQSSIELLSDSIASKVETTVYDLGIIDAKTYAEAKAVEAENASKAYVDLETEAARIVSEAYADGVVSDEEAARISDVQARLTEAKSYANSTAATAEQAAKDHANGIVAPLTSRITTAESSITQMSSQISLKANTTVTDALGSRTTTAEQNINGLQGSITSKVSTSDYNGNTIASLINQSATTVVIQASKINLVGAVSVLSDITGNLGSISAGTIVGTSIRGGEFILNGGTLDLRLGNILWGSNMPQSSYSAQAGTSHYLNDIYTWQSFSLNGHTHSDTQYVIPYTGQSLRLWRNGTKVRLYQGSAYTELTGITG